MAEGGRAALGIDTSVPNIARMYDYWLGGKDNFGADREAADRQARTRDQITGFFGDLTLVEPGLTDIWAWRPDAATVDTTSEFMRILGAVAKKD
jgi:S-adenosyl methyltransferase